MDDGVLGSLLPPHGVQVLAQVSDLRTKSAMSLALGLGCVIYMGINIVCLVLNGYEMEGPDPVISGKAFHMLEFWATFFFNIVQVLALLYTPKELGELYSSPTFLKVVILVNVGASFISALFVTINCEMFEMPSHELEYTNELTMAVVDLVLLASLLRNIDGRIWQRQNVSSCASLVMVVVAILIAAVQLCIYNLLGWEDGESNGEQLAHYFEFVFEAFSAAITFWFTIDNRFLAEARIEDLLGLKRGPPRAHAASDHSSEDDSEE